MRKYNKLVRDNIIELIEKDNGRPFYCILSDEDYQSELKRKLTEEVEEFLASNEVKELADIMEVIYALAKSLGYTKKKLEQIRKDKATVNGAFKKKIFLKEVAYEK